MINYNDVITMIKRYNDGLKNIAKQLREYSDNIQQYANRYDELWKEETTYLSWLPKEIYDSILAQIYIGSSGEYEYFKNLKKMKKEISDIDIRDIYRKYICEDKQYFMINVYFRNEPNLLMVSSNSDDIQNKEDELLGLDGIRYNKCMITFGEIKIRYQYTVEDIEIYDWYFDRWVIAKAKASYPKLKEKMISYNDRYMAQYHVSRLMELKNEMEENVKLIESFINRYEDIWKDKTTYLSWLPKEIFDIIFSDNNYITQYELNWNYRLKEKLSCINYRDRMRDLQQYLYENTVCYMVHYDGRQMFDCVILNERDLHVFSDDKYRIVKTMIKNARNYEWNEIGNNLMYKGCYFGFYIYGHITEKIFREKIGKIEKK